MASPDQTTSSRTSILLVDDQRFVGLALARLLDGEPGLELHCCERGAEAIVMAERLRPDVILQDLLLPDADGLALVRAFRQHSTIAPTPVIVLSGNDDEATRARALAAGADDYLVKLPSKEALLACVRRQRTQATAAMAARDAETADEVLDAETLAAYRDDGAADPEEGLRALVEVFLQDVDTLMVDLRMAIESRDARAARVAHALKGCALAIGAKVLAGHYAALEHAESAFDMRLDGIQAELARVKVACAQITTAGARPGVRAAG